MINELLRRERKIHCWTLAQAAEKLGELCDGRRGMVDDNMMSKWERKIHPPSAYYQEKLCQLYRKDPVELGLIESDDMHRRDVLKIGAAITLGIALPEPTYGAYDGALTTYWESYYSGNAANKNAMVQDWINHLQLSIQGTSGTTAQNQLRSFLSRYYQLSGVIARDSGDFKTARRQSDQALTQARFLEDAELITATLNRRARMHTEMEHYDLAVDDLEEAYEYAQHSRDPLRCYVNICLAEAYSLLSPDDKAVQMNSMKLLDEVEHTVRAKNVLDGDGSFMKVDVPGFHMVKSDILRRFGNIDQADTALQIVEATTSGLSLRWKGNLLISEAQLAHVRNDLDGACNRAKDALIIAEQTGSTAMKKKVSKLHSQLILVDKNKQNIQELGMALA